MPHRLIFTDSLSVRLLLTTGVILLAFFALVAFVLEESFKQTAEQALKEKLQIQVYALLSVAELTDNGQLKMPTKLPEPRFSTPGSGLYAAIYQTDKTLVWHSLSSIGLSLDFSQKPRPGEAIFYHQSGRFILDYAVIWENQSGLERYYVLTVAEDQRFLMDQIGRFRLTLWRWLLFIAFLLIIVQILGLIWSLKPLRMIGTDLTAIESGKKERLDGCYPIELQGLANNLNALISSERAHLERYRHTLADLAHSLKTPLTILTGCLEDQALNKPLMEEQIARMDEIIHYQLQRAAAKGQKNFMGKINPIPVIEKIIHSLEKVYLDKQINFIFESTAACSIYCEEGDFYEVVGNLLDNAAKWCNTTVKIKLSPLNNVQQPYSTVIEIEDDGQGIVAEKLQLILQRGVRADENIQGHGIGMAVVNELIELLEGQLIANKSPLGGVKWQVYWR